MARAPRILAQKGQFPELWKRRSVNQPFDHVENQCHLTESVISPGLVVIQGHSSLDSLNCSRGLLYRLNLSLVYLAIEFNVGIHLV